MGNQTPYIEVEQTTQWPKRKKSTKGQTTKHTHETKDRVTRTQQKTYFHNIVLSLYLHHCTL
jgi:hypothetical protein